jgi:acetyl esterase/lipase
MQFEGVIMKQMKNLLRYGALLLLVAGASLRGTAQETQVDRDVVYGEAGGEQLKLDVYRKANQNAVLPAIIAVHSGGWISGDKKEFADICRGLADAGFVAFSVNYRLVKENTNKWPAQLDDVQRAVRWIRANAAKYKIDPNRIGAVGASAGGHLVAHLGTRETRDNTDAALAQYSSRVTCVIDLFGPTDLTLTPEAANVSPIAVALVQGLIGKTPEEAPEAYKDASPIAFVDKKTVPMLIYHGTVDPLVPLDQSERLYKRLKEEGIEVQIIKGEGEGHSMPLKPETGQQLLGAAFLFLTLHLQAP